MVVMMIGVLCALAAAGFVMLKKRAPDEAPDKRMARALALLPCYRRLERALGG